MEGSVLSFLKAEWKMSDTGSSLNKLMVKFSMLKWSQSMLCWSQRDFRVNYGFDSRERELYNNCIRINIWYTEVMNAKTFYKLI
jgi:hypothetical protein